MAGRSRRPVRLGVVALAVMASLAPLCAGAGEVPREGAARGSFSAVMINVLGRETAFVRSFSASYPCQFRQQGEDRKKMDAVTVEDLGARER